MSTLLNQRINFYQSSFHKAVIRLPLKQMLTIWAVVLVLMAVLSVLDMLRTYNQQNTLKKMQASKIGMEASISKLQAIVDAMVLDQKLVDQEQYLRLGLQNKNQFLRDIRDQGDNHQVQFSHYLQALAELNAPNVWLTRIKLQSPGPNLTLSGITRKANSLPQYLDQLKTQTSFVGLGFRVFDLEREKGDSRYLTFSVGTQHDETTE